jgi:prepilin-type processing-associated H-X9-DG protein
MPAAGFGDGAASNMAYADGSSANAVFRILTAAEIDKIRQGTTVRPARKEPRQREHMQDRFRPAPRAQRKGKLPAGRVGAAAGFRLSAGRAGNPHGLGISERQTTKNDKADA